MLIRKDDRPVYVNCKRCGKTFKMGKSCDCGGVVTHERRDGSFVIEEDEKNIANIDSE